MRRFESLDALAKSFVRAYFSTNVYQLRNLPKFYADGAIVTRGGAPVIYAQDGGPKEVSLPLPNESTLTVVRYTPVRSGDAILVNVLGVVETAAFKSCFAQTFVLVEANNRLWINGDFLTVADDRLFESLDSDDFYTIEVEPRARKEKPKRQKGRRARGGRGGRQNPFVWCPDRDTE